MEPSISLERSWKVSRGFLEAAERVLASLCDARISHCLAEYRGYLEHNELELALDQLEEAAIALDESAASRCPPEFWEQMERAAESMKLEARAQQFRQQREIAPIT